MVQARNRRAVLKELQKEWRQHLRHSGGRSGPWRFETEPDPRSAAAAPVHRDSMRSGGFRRKHRVNIDIQQFTDGAALDRSDPAMRGDYSERPNVVGSKLRRGDCRGWNRPQLAARRAPAPVVHYAAVAPESVLL